MKSHATRGQGLVEFALVIPILLLLLLGLVELGRAWMTRNIMTGAAREAARVYVVPEGSYDNAILRATEILTSGGIVMSPATDNVSIVDTGAYGTCTVIITHRFHAIFGGFIPGLDNVALVTTTSMRREY